MPLGEELELLLLLALEELLPVDVVEPLPALGWRPVELEEELLLVVVVVEDVEEELLPGLVVVCLLYTSPSPRDDELSRMPSSA